MGQHESRGAPTTRPTGSRRLAQSRRQAAREEARDQVATCSNPLVHELLHRNLTEVTRLGSCYNLLQMYAEATKTSLAMGGR